MSAERYFQLWRDSISNSDMSEPLKSDILAYLDLVLFGEMHLLIVTIPSQRAVSLAHGRVWVRDGDQTKEASPEKILSVSARFIARAA